ncbi:hypothetical protein FHS29_003676 [Saccharothrix tamanrassetensis]|uniref:Capsular polysaccharide biosynthesis protein n=1 Tax=Saccharothrix tamanrassetensis TaxID=1051531 RepID=A0A841CJC7_9PSEU|nr:hypothetical protein [Saccharothrix tamanrassetensis]MBB5957083.1 hypothetical protein [Saccharothrix tamanrassetensis]
MKARLVGESAVAALLVGALVLIATVLKGEEYQGRVGLLAGPAGPEAPQYGEVVALSLPALVEVARSPSVLVRTGTEAERVSVELVPASGLARLSVRAPSAGQAGNEAAAVAQAVVDANLLAPAGKLRVLDTPEVIRVAPDWPLTIGLALAAAVAAGIAVAAVRHLRRTRVTDGVRAALSSAGVGHPVAVVRDDDPALVERLTVLCGAAARPARVVAVVPELAPRAESLTERLPDKAYEPADGVALIAVAPTGARQDELASVVGALPAGTTVVAVVLA